MDMVQASEVKQWVDFPADKLKNTLDLIITVLDAEVQIKNIHFGPYISNHSIITCTFNLSKTKINSMPIKYRNFKADVVEMIGNMDLDSIPLDSENLEEILSLFKSCVSVSVDKHAPENYQKSYSEIVSHGATKNCKTLKD